jgi:hypothetical protein
MPNWFRLFLGAADLLRGAQRPIGRAAQPEPAGERVTAVFLIRLIGEGTIVIKVDAIACAREPQHIGEQSSNTGEQQCC